MLTYFHQSRSTSSSHTHFFATFNITYSFPKTQLECNTKPSRSARQTNATLYEWGDAVPAAVRADDARRPGVVAQGGAAPCVPATDDAMALELDLLVDSKDILSVDTLVRADHRSTLRKYFLL